MDSESHWRKKTIDSTWCLICYAFFILERTDTFEEAFEQKLKEYNGKSPGVMDTLKEIFLIGGVALVLILFLPTMITVMVKQSKKLRKMAEGPNIGNETVYCA